MSSSLGTEAHSFSFRRSGCVWTTVIEGFFQQSQQLLLTSNKVIAAGILRQFPTALAFLLRLVGA